MVNIIGNISDKVRELEAAMDKDAHEFQQRELTVTEHKKSHRHRAYRNQDKRIKNTAHLGQY